MTVHWTINGIAACRSPLASVAMTRCSRSRKDEFNDDVAKLEAAWPYEKLTLAVVEGPCKQQEIICRCDYDYNCGCGDWTDPIDNLDLRGEYERQLKMLNSLSEKERSDIFDRVERTIAACRERTNR